MSVTTAPAAPAAPRRRVLQGALSGSGASWLLVPPIVFLLLLLGLPIVFLVIRTFTNAGLSTAVDDDASATRSRGRCSWRGS